MGTRKLIQYSCIKFFLYNVSFYKWFCILNGSNRFVSIKSALWNFQSSKTQKLHSQHVTLFPLLLNPYPDFKPLSNAHSHGERGARQQRQTHTLSILMSQTQVQTTRHKRTHQTCTEERRNALKCIGIEKLGASVLICNYFNTAYIDCLQQKKGFNSDNYGFEREINVLGQSRILFYTQLFFFNEWKIINNL